MKIIDRYMLRTLLVPLAACLAAFSLLFVILDLFGNLSKILEASLHPHTVALYYLALLLTYVEYLAPASLMLSTLYALWQLTRNHELTALQASGISLHRILTPFLSVALLFTLALAVIKDTVGIRAVAWTTSVRHNKFSLPDDQEIRTDFAYYDSRTRREWLIGEFDANHPASLSGVQIKQERADHTLMQKFTASRAEHLDGTWWFYDLRAQQYDEQENPIGAEIAMSAGTNTPCELVEFTEQPASLALEVRNWEFLSTWDMLRYLRHHPDLAAETATRKRFDIHSRLAMPWACLVVTLFGIPAGAKTGRQSPLTSIFLAIAFFLGYYMLIQVGTMLGKPGTIPTWLGAWLSNIVFFISGVAMLARMR